MASKNNLINSEVKAVLASMRLNTKFSSKPNVQLASNKAQNLVTNLKKLQALLTRGDSVSLYEVLDPFLAVIRSEETSGPITGQALSSVDKFIVTLLVEEEVNKVKVLESIADSVTHCRFEATDPESDEVVLMKILKVLSSCISTPFSVELNDEVLLEIIQTCFRMSNQPRLSELLRKTAEQTLVEIIYIIFYNSSLSKKNININESSKPFTESCISRLFQFLCSIITPYQNTIHTIENDRIEEDTILLGLTLITTIIETSSSVLVQYPQMLVLTRDELFKNLLRCCQMENILILTRSLNVLLNLLLSCREYLKPQIELFFLVINKTVDSKGATYEQQEMMLEVILEICRHPLLVTDLYVNYDCDRSCPNLFENLCKFLYKNAFPVSGNLYATHLLALESLLSILHSIANNMNNTIMEQDIYRKKKEIKTLLLSAGELFSKSTEESIQFLISNKLIGENDAAGVAQFLRYTYGINKTAIGEYLGKKKDFNIAVLEEYIKTFNFNESSKFGSSLREFLESFRIPGEAPIISRVLELFAKYYCERVKETFANTDAAYILSYSIVMLNVDQHNPEVKNRMTEQEFIRNNRGINDKKDLPQEMLKEIYYNIKTNEIKIPEEQLFIDVSSQWRHVLTKQNMLGDFIISKNIMYNEDIFTLVWGPLIAALSVVLDTSDTDSILERSIDGFNICAKIASHYHLSDVLDNLITSLCKFSSLLALPNTSGALTLLGRNKKSLLTTKAMFNIVAKYPENVNEGWKNIITSLITLNKLDCLPSNIIDKVEPFDTIDSSPTSNNIPLSSRAATSLLSTLGLLGSSSWFGGTTEVHEEEFYEQDPQAEQVAKQTIKDANIHLIIQNTKNISNESLVNLLKSIQSQFPKMIASTHKSLQYDEKTSLFCIDLISTITVYNQDRLGVFWHVILDHLVSLLMGFQMYIPFAEKILVNFVSLCIKLVSLKDQNLSLVSEAFPILQKLHSSSIMAEPLARKSMLGLAKYVEYFPTFLKDQEGLEVLGAYIDYAVKYPNAESVAFRLISTLLSSNSYFTKDNYKTWILILVNMIKSKAKNDVITQSMELLYNIYGRIPLLHSQFNISNPADTSNSVDISSYELAMWRELWFPILDSFVTICKDNRSDIRNISLTYLQKCLLSPQLTNISASIWFLCFEEILFPLVKNLIEIDLKPTTPSSSPTKLDFNLLEETRLRASALLSKIFLQYLPKIIQLPQFNTLWIQILRFIEMYMKADDNDLLSEAVRESLKNMLLVMSASGIFKPGNISSGEDLWALSWSTIDSFCPNLKYEFNDVLNPNSSAENNKL